MKDKIGSVVRALIAVPYEYLGILLDLAIKLGGKDGAFWYQRLVTVSKEVVESTGDMFNASEYFTTRSGLYVWVDFILKILPAYNSPILKRGIEGVDFVNLPRNMSDCVIIAEYFSSGEEVRKHAFTLDQIADLIDAQNNGEDGALLNNGYANIFYVVGKNNILFAVGVRWSSGNSNWSIDAFDLVEAYHWDDGHRVFRNKN